MPPSDPRRPGSDVVALPPNLICLSTDAVLTRRLHSQFLIQFWICCAMASFKEFRQTLLLYYDADLITDEDFIILYELFSSRNPDFAYDSYDRFDLDNMNDDECKAEFRVRKRDLPTLAQALRIPRSFQLSQRSVVDGMEGLCMLLKRLAYPCRYGDLIYRFGRPVPVFSITTNHVLDYIYNTHNHLIKQWNHTLLSPRALEVCAEFIHGKGAALENCFGFVGGTVRPISQVS